MSKEIIKVKEDLCVGCNKCIRNCPVFDANVAYSRDGSSKVSVVHEKCIVCGKCIEVCDHEARDFNDDTKAFFEDLRNGKKVSIVAAPAVRVNFDRYKKLFAYLKSMGVNFIYDVSFGADITTWAYLKAIKENSLTSVVAQPCPAIVNYIEKYKPSIIDSLAPVHSPTLCTAIYLKKYENVNDDIAFLSPCIGKTLEFKDPNTNGYVRYNVTFKKLKEHIEETGVNLLNYQDMEFDDMGCSLGCVFCRPGGLRENVEAKVKNAWVRQVEGKEHAYSYLDDYSERITNRKDVPLLVDILNCASGCSLGTATVKGFSVDDSDSKLNKMKVEKLNDKGGKLRAKKIDWLYSYFEKNLTLSDFFRGYNKNILVAPLNEPTKADYDRIFKQLHKNTDTERAFNCSACGYASCEDMVKAIHNGLNDTFSCLDYNRHEALLEKEKLEEKQRQIEEKNNEVYDLLEKTKGLSEERLKKSQKLATVITQVAEGSDITSSKINSVNDTFSKIAENTENVATFVHGVSSSVNSIVDSMDNIKKSLGDISLKSNRSTQITSDAQKKAHDANEIIEKLSNSSNEIGKIINVIDGIAGQTNMLALNAAIEAAGAGEAGKGFAVVASEVKDLSKQTSEATDEISQQIEVMQNNIAEVVNVVREIGGVICEINDISNIIASLVQNQHGTTEVISGGITQAAEKVNSINEKIKNISESSLSATKDLQEAATSVDQIATTTGQLNVY